MAKRRQRVSKAVPAKGRLRDMCDRLWALAVKDDPHRSHTWALTKTDTWQVGQRVKKA